MGKRFEEHKKRQELKSAAWAEETWKMARNENAKKNPYASTEYMLIEQMKPKDISWPYFLLAAVAWGLINTISSMSGLMLGAIPMVIIIGVLLSGSRLLWRRSKKYARQSEAYVRAKAEFEAVNGPMQQNGQS